MLPITSASRASACSWVSFSFLTRRASCPSVTPRAFSTAASTNFWSMSLTTTGMSAAAIACAISPPMGPPPTTAALETNMKSDPSLFRLDHAAEPRETAGYTDARAGRDAGRFSERLSGPFNPAARVVDNPADAKAGEALHGLDRAAGLRRLDWRRTGFGRGATGAAAA